VPADTPTILATSGGFREADRLAWEVGPLTRYAIELAGVTGRAPKVCFLATACADDARLINTFYDNAWREGCSAAICRCYRCPTSPMPAPIWSIRM
jgi:hypothetical protein